MGEENKKKEIIDFLLKNNVIVTEELFKLFENDAVLNSFYSFFFLGDLSNIDKLKNVSQEILGTDLTQLKFKNEINQSENNNPSKNQQENVINENIQKDIIKETQDMGSVKVIFSYKDKSKKREFQDFVSYFNNRYNVLKNMLMNRKNMDGAISLLRASQKEEKEKVAVIGIISEKRETRNGHIMLELEDPTGKINVLISKNNSEFFSLGKDLVLDEVVGIYGQSGKGIIFASEIIFPDIPLIGEIKKSPEEVYAIFTGDLHFGSKSFLKEDFEKFLQWLKGKTGSEEQRTIAKKTKYIFMVGDLIDGVGTYPNQEKDLEVVDLYNQYDLFAEYLKKIPSHIKIIICAGNHDAMRIAEPQLPIYKDFAEKLWTLPNVINVSNPSIVNIHSGNGFPGFNVLIYHGFSFFYYSENVESIRINGGMERADLIMKFLLQRRHLAPTHTSNQYIPDIDSDPLVIEKVPDIFVTGHIHRVSFCSFNLCSNSSCAFFSFSS